MSCSDSFCSALDSFAILHANENWRKLIYSRILSSICTVESAQRKRKQNSDRRRRRASRTRRPICEHLKIPSDITVSCTRNRRRIALNIVVISRLDHSLSHSATVADCVVSASSTSVIGYGFHGTVESPLYLL